MSDRLSQLEEALGTAHGCVFFSPTKGYHCDLLCSDREQSWITGSGESITEAVDRAQQVAVVALFAMEEAGWVTKIADGLYEVTRPEKR